MKKILKILLLILFTLFVLGITTSNAATYFSVDSTTTATTMLEQLKAGNMLTGISDRIRDQNLYLLCVEKQVYLYNHAEYTFKDNDATPITYPADDEINGYAKAYILAAPGYTDIDGKLIPFVKSDDKFGVPNKDDERQYAWYCINGEETDGNDLYNLSIAYQNYKKTEKSVTLTEDDKANTIVSGENIVYGPFQIEYTYQKAESNSKFDEWGGFNYAFFDENGNNISDKVKLCALSDNIYTEVKSTLISSNNETNGYYKVSTADYNKVNLYIVTSDKNITKIKIKVQSNIVDYEAKVYFIEGGKTLSVEGTNFCSSCMSKVTDITSAIGNSNALVQYGSNFYRWVSTTTNQVEALYGTVKNYCMYGDTQVELGSATVSNPTTNYVYFGKDGSVYSTLDLAAGTYVTYAGVNFRCTACNYSNGTYTTVRSHAKSHVSSRVKYMHVQKIHNFTLTGGCGRFISYNGKAEIFCGDPYRGGYHSSQGLIIIDTTSVNRVQGEEIEIDIELAFSIEVTKVWNDASNADGNRPDDISLNVYRSKDKTNWELLTNGTDYTIKWLDKDGDNWKAYIIGLTRIDENGNDYYFKVEEEISSEYYEVSYNSGDYTDGKVDNVNSKSITITNAKFIDLGGYVWLDEQTGVKPAKPYNGIMDSNEKKIENIPVYLYYKDANTNTFIKKAETVTDKNGHYKFEKLPVGSYYVEFEYDGINYEDTLNIEIGSSKAFENSEARNVFNKRFETISYNKSNDGTVLNYNYADKKSTLITSENGKVKTEFIMKAATAEDLHDASVDNLNLGLVKRGTDLALSTDVHDAKVSINGQETTYKYNKDNNSIGIGTIQSSENAIYNLSLYTSDYNYRIKDYIKHNEFKENSFINEEDTSALGELQTLKVNVVYKLNLQNQTGAGRDVDTGEDIITKINEVKYVYDEKYTFNKDMTFKYNNINYTDNGNSLIITPDVTLKPGETKTIYLVFEVKDNEITSADNFSNNAEITSYSTSKGLIDVDSQPGNFINGNQIEDDNDTAGRFGITLGRDERKITGNVFDEDGNKVNDVIVQLIELKTVDGKVYEYIWQETVSGAETGLRLSNDGKALEDYNYTKADGYYEFKGFIPGDYIVRFIYGDGTTYDLTENVIKYNGQDYKSMLDANYNVEWYNSSSYEEGASVARDNEARRLETMAFSVEVNSVKGVLLKLLNNVSSDTLNLTEKEILVATYNAYSDSDIEYTNIKDVSSDDINQAISYLLKEVVLNKTWMCAETSKIKVVVDNTSQTTSNKEELEGINAKSSYENINFGLELRPATKIELKKYITGFKLVASNGTTLVNAKVDVNEYLTDEYEENPIYINNKVLGVKDNVTILDSVWQYEVVPTDINTIVDGASLEFEYTLVVKNASETDYLSTELAEKYQNNSITDYKTFLLDRAKELKTAIRNGTYGTQIGKSLGNNYYVGGIGSKQVLTEVTKIRDYINNDLTFVTSGNVAIDDNVGHMHRILRDDYSMQDATLKTILKTTEATGKMENDGEVVLYTVALGKNPISSTGNLNFENYIAEIMSYTNAAGRRTMMSTPGNAEIVDQEHREGKSHEIDEADTGRIQIGVATGEDVQISHIIIISVALGIAVVALGAYIVKKYIIR